MATISDSRVKKPITLCVGWELHLLGVNQCLIALARLDDDERSLAVFALDEPDLEVEGGRYRALLAKGHEALERLRSEGFHDCQPGARPREKLAEFVEETEEVAAIVAAAGRFDPQPIVDFAAALEIAWREIHERRPDVEGINRAYVRASRTVRAFRNVLLEAAKPADPMATEKSADPRKTIAPPPREGKRINKPSELAIATYRLRVLTGLDQKALATRMQEERGIPFDQSKVSRYLKAVDKWLDAGNILPDLPTARPKPITMDPAKLEQGRRRDGRTRHR